MAEMAHEKGHAGKSAREMADKRYSKRVTVTLIGLAALVVLLLLLPNIKGLGIAGLVAIAVFMRLIMDSTDRETRRYRKLEKRAVRGAKGEEDVGEILRQLPSGYTVFHDLPSSFGNIDHVVVNQDNVYLIETKAHFGNVIHNGTNLLINFKLPEKDFIDQVLKNTFWLRDHLLKKTGRRVFIKPLLVFTNAFVRVPSPIKNITIINKKYLLENLTKSAEATPSESKLSEPLIVALEDLHSKTMSENQ